MTTENHEPCAVTLTEADFARASAETERLQRELDITNADHIALWLESNMGDSALGWLACRIIEAHEQEVSLVRLAHSQAGEVGKVYCPGVLRCAKCDFRLIKTTLNLADGEAYANNEPDRCPNCDVPMWRVTWKDEAKEAYAVAESQMNRALEAEQRN